MTTHMQISLAATVLLMVGLSVGQAGEPNDSTVSLKFEVRKTSLGPLDVRRSGLDYHVFAARRPPYAAGVPFEGPTAYLAPPGDGLMNEFLHFVLGEALGMPRTETHDGLSTAQKEFLRATAGLLNSDHMGSGPIPQWHRSPDEPNSPKRLLLYAMTLEDAKKMVEAYVQFVTGRWRREVEGQEEQIAAIIQGIAAAEEQLCEAEKMIETSRPALEALKEKIPYRTEKEAMGAVAELDRMLNATLVDIAGIQARIEAIQDRQSQSPVEAEAAKLRMMFVEESVSLQGAQARKAMATQLRADANRFLDLKESLATAARRSEELPKLLTQYRNNLEGQQNRLEDLILPEKPQIAEHTIMIYPIEWIGEGEGN